MERESAPREAKAVGTWGAPGWRARLARLFSACAGARLRVAEERYLGLFNAIDPG